MSLSSTTSRNDYVGTGATSVYSYTFRVFAATDLLVTTRTSLGVQATLVLTTDYTVTGVGASGGGAITLVAGVLASGTTLTIRRVMSLTQLVDIVNQGKFFAKTHEDEFDRLTMFHQQQQDLIDRSVKLPESVPATASDPTLPKPVAGDTFRWNAGVTALEAVNLGNILPSGSFAFPGGTGMLAQISPGVGAARAITAGAGISVADGNGVAANPTVSVPSLGITAAMLASSAVAQIFQARLTLATVTPVTITDQLAKGTVFLTPYKGNRIALFDGTNWKLYALSEISIAVSATTSKIFDLFCFDSGGTPTLEALAWTNDTTRATALVLQDGVLVKSGAPTRRYVGSYRTTTVANQTEDSLVKRYLWNYYNRVARPMAAVDATASWTYTTDVFRQANANAANQLDFVIGFSEDPVDATAVSLADNSGADRRMQVGIGLDSTTVTSGVINGFSESTADHVEEFHAIYKAYPGIGRHFLAWLERSEAANTTTWRGTPAGNGSNAGIMGEVMG